MISKSSIASQLANKTIQLKDQHHTSTVHQERTKADLHKREEPRSTITRIGRFWERTVSLVLKTRDHNAIRTSEQTTVVSALAVHNIQVSPEVNPPDLLVVSPAIDGRLKDEGKESNGE